MVVEGGREGGVRNGGVWKVIYREGWVKNGWEVINAFKDKTCGAIHRP